MDLFSDKMRADLQDILRLQRNIKRIGAGGTAQWDPATQNLLKKLGTFVNEYNNLTFTVRLDDNGNPNIDFTWTT